MPNHFYGPRGGKGLFKTNRSDENNLANTIGKREELGANINTSSPGGDQEEELSQFPSYLKFSTMHSIKVVE